MQLSFNKDYGPVTSLLLEQITKHSIPPWPAQAQYDRVLVWKVADDFSASEKTASGALYLPIQTVDINTYRSPHGVIVSAGLGAMDVLETHGMQLGEMVWYSPHVCYRLQTGRKENGHEIEFWFMDIGDIIAGENSLDCIKSGKISIKWNDKHSKHMYYDELRSEWLNPIKPKKYADNI